MKAKALSLQRMSVISTQSSVDEAWQWGNALTLNLLKFTLDINRIKPSIAAEKKSTEKFKLINTNINSPAHLRWSRGFVSRCRGHNGPDFQRPSQLPVEPVDTLNRSTKSCWNFNPNYVYCTAKRVSERLRQLRLWWCCLVTDTDLLTCGSLYTWSQSQSLSLCICVQRCGLWAFSSSTRNSSIDNNFPLKHTVLMLNTHTQETPWSRFHVLPSTEHIHHIHMNRVRRLPGQSGLTGGRLVTQKSVCSHAPWGNPR